MTQLKIFFSVLMIICAGQYSIGQEIEKTGKVTFTTSKNVYVRFDNTELMAIGDTLFINKDNALMPCLIITQKSSNSTVNTVINNIKLITDDQIVFRKIIIETKNELPEEEIETIAPIEKPLSEEVEPEKGPMFRERIRARISFASYSSLSNRENDDRHRIMLRGNVNARNINGGRFSFESYVNYRQNIVQPGSSANGLQSKFLRLYNLALTYDVDSTMRISLGRKINRKVSSLGAIDGLQVEKYFGNFFIGALGGFKPDLYQFDFNPDLLQYGGYIGISSSSKNFYLETTAGLIEQQNGGAVDRRYAYFQHSSTIGKKLNLFGSAEVDIYQNINGVVTSQPRLTNLYASLRYRFSRAFSLTLSYDTRKRIIYYETLRTEVEKLLADDQARQGLRARINIRPFRYINIGASYSRRFQNDNQNRSDNMNAYISHSKLPGIGGRFSVNVNMNESNYLKTRIYGTRYSRSLIRRKLSTDLYFRRVEYSYFGNESTSVQDYIGASFNIRLAKKLSLNILGEIAKRSTENNYRINTRLIKRF